MTTTKRTRLSPHDRRMQLLDSAKVIIESQGLSSMTIEALAREAGVSNPLVYKYFDTRISLLQELLVRETERFNEQIRDQVTKAKDFPDLVTIIVSVNFEQFSSANILNILRGQPDILISISEMEKKGQGEMGRFLVRSLADHYDINRKDAGEIVTMAAGASQAAAAHFNQFGGDRAAQIETAVRFVFGGIEALLLSPDEKS